MKKATIAAWLLLCASQLNAQVKNEKEYREHSKEVAAEIWSKKSPEFSVSEVPQDLNGESAVIIAKSVNVVNTAKLKRPMFGGSVSDKVSYDNTIHVRVKINDKAALNDFSSIEYEKQLVRNSRSGWSKTYNQLYTFVGAKVIKPGGKEIIVNGDEEVLTVDEEKKKKGKLAISDLQVGDILDYYVREEVVTQMGHDIQGPYTYFLNTDYPIMSLKLHMELDERAGAIYVSANGAPKPVVKKNDNGPVIDLELKNLKKSGDTRWTLPYRQFPYVSIEYKVMMGSQDDRMSDFDRGDVKPSEGWDSYFTILKNYYKMSFNKSAAPFYWERAREYFGGKGNLRKTETDSLVKVLYNFMLQQAVLGALASSSYTMADINDRVENMSIFDFSTALERSDVLHELVFVTPRYGPKKENVMIGGSTLIPLLHVKGNKDLWIGFENMNFFSNKLPYWVEGEEAEGFSVKEGWRPVTYKMPVSKAVDNVISENLEVSLAADNMQSLQVKRNTKLTGHFSEPTMKDLQTTEGYVKSLYAVLGKTGDLEKDLKEAKVKKDVSSSVVAGFAKSAETQKKDFEDEIENWFDQEPKDIKNYKVTEQTPTSFSYTSTFLMENWVKKAGNNYIVEAGRLIGGFEKVEEKDRERKLDIYMSFARTLEFSYTITVPAGYAVKGIENFTKSVKSDVGEFISSATLNGDKVQFNAKRVYNNSYYAVANWPKLLDLMDAAYDFTQQKLLLEKAK